MSFTQRDLDRLSEELKEFTEGMKDFVSKGGFKGGNNTNTNTGSDSSTQAQKISVNFDKSTQKIVNALANLSAELTKNNRATSSKTKYLEEFNKVVEKSTKVQQEAAIAEAKIAAKIESEKNNNIRKEKDTVAKSAKMSEEFIANLESSGKFINKFAREVTSLSRSVTSGAGSFSTLTEIISSTIRGISKIAGMFPGVGKIVSAFGEVAADVSQMLIEQFQTGWNAYKDLADVGLASSFEDMKLTADATGLLFQDVNSALSKYTTDIAKFGGTMMDGTKEFRLISESLTDVRRDFAALGISAVEFTEFQAKYIAQETRQGRARNMTNDQLAKGTTDYIEKLDTLSKLTGASRKNLQAQIDAAQSETRFAAALDQMGDKARQSFEDLNILVSEQGGPGLAQGLRDLASGAVTTDAAKQLVLQSGGVAMEVVEKMRNGSISQIDAFNQLTKSVKANLPSMGQLGQFMGDASNYTKNYAEARKLANSKEITPEKLEEARRAREANIQGANKQTKALAATEQNLYNASTNLQLMATSSELVTSAMESLSDGVDYLSEKLYEMSGKELPEDLKLRREEREVIKELNKAKKEQLEVESDTSPTNNDLLKVQSRTKNLQDELAKEQAFGPAANQDKIKQLESDIKMSKRGEELLANRSKTMSGETSRASTKVEDLQKKADEATSKRKQFEENKRKSKGGSQQTTPSSAPSSSSTPNPDTLNMLTFGDNSGSRDRFLQLDKGLREKVLAAAEEYHQFTGGKDKLRINSAVRTFEEQERLYEETVKAGRPGIGPSGMVVSKPIPGVKNSHEQGVAVDIQQGKSGPQQAISILNKHGLRQTVQNDPVHFQQARTGGIFKGPSTGYNVELHGHEMVVPMNEGVSKQALNTSVLNQDTTMIKNLIDMFRTIQDQNDQMISLMSRQVDNSHKLVQAAY